MTSHVSTERDAPKCLPPINWDPGSCLPSLPSLADTLVPQDWQRTMVDRATERRRRETKDLWVPTKF